jgi:signal transduction histidine kinase
MIIAPTPTNENERLAALYSYCVLDTPAEAGYDEITNLAKQISNCPAAVINLIDTDRQWFKSKQGVDAEGSCRELSFCGHTICTENGILSVIDARTDPRFHDNPFTTNPTAPCIFYYGVSLENPEGYRLGTLCVFDSRPRTLSTKQEETLQSLAHMAVSLLELKRTTLRLAEKEHALAAKNAEMTRFAHMMAHDLSEPARNIEALMDLLQSEISTPEGTHIVTLAKTSASRLTSTIKDLLQFAEVSHKTMLPATIQWSAVADIVEQNLAQQIAQSGAKITWHDLKTTLFGYETLIIHALQNLVSNAIKYSKFNTTPEVTIACEEHSDHWMVRVCDNGIGIAPEDREKIFAAFGKLHGKAEFPGTGLGLSICKLAAEKHRGRIWVESVPGMGSTFYITFAKELSITPAEAKEAQPDEQRTS